MSQALIMLCKYPIPGQVKTRIAVDTSDQIAADIQARMLHYIVATHINSKEYDFIIGLRQADLLTQFESEYNCYHPHNFTQYGTNLGDIMNHAIQHGLQNYSKIIIIGSDTPLISQHDIVSGFDNLNNSDVVLGPVTDGGYWCIGSRQAITDVIVPITYSTDTVLQETTQALDQHHYSFTLLDTKTDIDTIDLRNSIQHLIP